MENIISFFTKEERHEKYTIEMTKTPKIKRKGYEAGKYE